MGMSPKTVAWGIVLIGVVSLSLHAFVSHRAGSILSGWSFVAFAAALILGLLQPQADAKRFLPPCVRSWCRCYIPFLFTAYELVQTTGFRQGRGRVSVDD